MSPDEEPATCLVYVQLESGQIEALHLEAQRREIHFDTVVSEAVELFLEGAAPAATPRSDSALLNCLSLDSEVRD